MRAVPGLGSNCLWNRFEPTVEPLDSRHKLSRCFLGSPGWDSVAACARCSRPLLAPAACSEDPTGCSGSALSCCAPRQPSRHSPLRSARARSLHLLISRGCEAFVTSQCRLLRPASCARCRSLPRLSARNSPALPDPPPQLASAARHAARGTAHRLGRLPPWQRRLRRWRATGANPSPIPSSPFLRCAHPGATRQWVDGASGGSFAAPGVKVRGAPHSKRRPWGRGGARRAAC
jgi:hypothetical protein